MTKKDEKIKNSNNETFGFNKTKLDILKLKKICEMNNSLDRFISRLKKKKNDLS